MKTRKVMIAAMMCGAMASCAGSRDSGGVPRPDRTIMFVIDGLASGVHEKIDMPALEALIGEGVLFSEVYLPLADHPEYSAEYPWKCSIPNPVMMSGSLFIGQDSIRESLIQHYFRERPTAFVLAAKPYTEVSEGFTIYDDISNGTDSLITREDLVVERAMEIILRDNPEFMRIHCQSPGNGGNQTSLDLDAPYANDIYHPQSPYRIQMQFTDRELGRFVGWLREQGLWESTLLMVVGDHGQAPTGWHPPYLHGGNVTELVVAGIDGVDRGARYDYAELIDLVPTIAWLHGIETPRYSNGRVLEEIFDPSKRPAEIPQLMRILDEALIGYHGLDPEMPDPRIMTIRQIGSWHKTPAGADYAAFVKYQVDNIERFREER